MSQIYKRLTATGPIPANIPTSFVTDSGTAIPAANVLNVLTSDTSSNFDNGITDIGSGNTVTIQLTNRVTGQVSTTDATPTTIITFATSSNLVYSVSGTVTLKVTASGGGATLGDGASYDFYGAFKNVAGTVSEIGTEYPTTFEDASLAAADITVSVSGTSVIVQVIGIATNINWDAILTYRQV